MLSISQLHFALKACQINLARIALFSFLIHINQRQFAQVALELFDASIMLGQSSVGSQSKLIALELDASFTLGGYKSAHCERIHATA